MNPTAQTQEQDFNFGSADSAAQKILDGYFEEADKDQAEQADENDARNPETAASEAQESEAEMAAPTDDGVGDESEEQQQYTVAELAEHLGVDASALYGADIVMSDGTRVSYGQMKDEWQATKKQREELETGRRQLEYAYQNLQQQQVMMQAQGGMGQLAPDQEEQWMIAEWMNMDKAEKNQEYWSSQQDQGAAARALQQVSARKRELEGKIQGKQQERAKKAGELQLQYMQAAQADIAQRIPEWQDGQTRQQDWNDIQGLGTRFGLTPQQIDSLWQAPPLMHMTQMFLKLLRQYKNADPKAKKIVPIKGLKPAGRKSQGSKNKPNEALVRAAKSGNRKAQDALGSQILDEFLR